MNTEFSHQQNYELLKWLNSNHQMLLYNYPNQYIAFNPEGLIAHSENLEEILDLAKASQKTFVIYLVPLKTASIVIHSIRFRSVTRHNWLPDYPAKLKHKKKEIDTLMLVDSGAEVSLISYKMGQQLGYALADSESKLLAETIGGTVEYVMRDVEMVIDNHSFIAPVAWLQQITGGEQLLLGREVVFDKFNIEFRQAEERIIFTWCGDNTN
ncbi:MAG: retropepsin-like domain-containing protein, partial [Spirulinaceae cyanobacterium]